MDADLLRRVTKAAADAFGGGPVLAAYAHGSRVGGRPRPDSDLDVGYYLQRRTGEVRLSLAEEMQLTDQLSRALEIEVDLRPLADAPLELRGRVLEEGVRIYSAGERERVGLERDLLCRYFDYKAIYRRMHEIRAQRKTGA